MCSENAGEEEENEKSDEQQENAEMADEDLVPSISDMHTSVQTQFRANSDLTANAKQYKKFDFFYRRTAFRSMNEYFKEQFNPIFKKWKESERKQNKSNRIKVEEKAFVQYLDSTEAIEEKLKFLEKGKIDIMFEYTCQSKEIT